MNSEEVQALMNVIESLVEAVGNSLKHLDGKIKKLEKRDKNIKKLEKTVFTMQIELDKLTAKRNEYNRFEAMEIDDEPGE